MFYEALAFGN